MNLDDLKNTEVYKGKSLSDLLQTVVEHSLEERQKALETYDFIREQMKSADEVFMFGEKASPYLKIANDATETINKMLGSLNKLKELYASSENNENHSSVDDILDILENNNIGPQRFFEHDELDLEEDLKKDKSNV